MADRTSNQLSTIATKLSAIRPRATSNANASRAIDRFLIDADATRFHLDRDAHARPTLLVVLGGTGTGKSTVVNRLLNARDDAPLTASSFRRTFTAGAVAIAHESTQLPERWLGIEHVALQPHELPARGRADALSIVRSPHDLLNNVTLIDTPDLDGDQPAHHAQADRAFRWADGVLFVVTPEKYQMTELLPYYRLANRYALPAMFVMNKTEERAVVDDYAKQLNGILARDDVQPFIVARDDAGFEPPADRNLDALRAAVSQQSDARDKSERTRGNQQRVSDLLGRLRDQVLAPLRDDRQRITRRCESMRAMEAPTADVDVSPLMLQLRRRLQQRSVLYLMGPGRMLDRVRQVPSLLARLPRGAWDLLRTGQATLWRDDENHPAPDPAAAHGLAFRTALVEQFRVIQARIDDVMQSSGTSKGTGDLWLDPDRAGGIADDELAKLKDWLETKWNATPRDTALLGKLIKYIPGGEKLSKWSEAAPYILAAVVAAHHAFFGPIDLAVIGGFSLATWLTERLSNEVASRARIANRNITRRFEKLAHEQIQQACAWLDARAPSDRELDELTKLADSMSN